MKSSSFVSYMSITLVIILSKASDAIDHQNKNNNDEQKKSNLRKSSGRRLIDSMEADDDGMYHVVVHYNEQHDFMMQRFSQMSGHVDHDFEGMHAVAMSAGEKDIFQLESDPSVSMVEPDLKRYPQVMPYEENEHDRLLQEEISRIWEDEMMKQMRNNNDSNATDGALGSQVMDGQDEMFYNTSSKGEVSARVRRRLQESGLYGIGKVQAYEAWQYARGQGIRVCVVDSGIYWSHTDFVQNRLRGFSLNNNLRWYEDGDGHGTHVAGTIAAADNSRGVVGVAPDVDLYIVRVFGNDGRWAYTSGLVDAAQRCVAAGARIISMSLGGTGSSTFERDAFQSIANSNVLIIAAAGNDGPGAPFSYPASYDGVISVAAVDSNDQRASFSEINQFVDISGPGVRILSTYPNNRFATLSGTSMATPHVSGVAALLWSYMPNTRANEIRNALFATAKDLGVSGKDTSYGYGLVQALDGIQYLGGGTSSLQFVEIRNRGGLCMDLHNFDTTNGNKVHLVRCKDNDAQKFVFDTNGRIRSKIDPNKCVEAGPRGGLYDKMFIWDCHDNTYQRWWRYTDGRIKNQGYTSKYMGVAYCGTNSQYTRLELRNYESGGTCGDAQRWSW